MRYNEPGIRIGLAPAERTVIKNYSTDYVDWEGPYFDLSKLVRALDCEGLYDTEYNRGILRDASINVIYYKGSCKVTFHFDVSGWNYFENPKAKDDTDSYIYNLRLVDIIYESDYTYGSDNHQYDFMINRVYWSIKSLIFATDLIMDYEYCGNKHNHPDKWYYDIEYMSKLYNEYTKLDEIKDDFE
jgi:hypothetical protein